LVETSTSSAVYWANSKSPELWYTVDQTDCRRYHSHNYTTLKLFSDKYMLSSIPESRDNEV